MSLREQTSSQVFENIPTLIKIINKILKNSSILGIEKKLHLPDRNTMKVNIYVYVK